MGRHSNYSFSVVLLFLLLAVPLLFTGCAGKTTVVLLPDPDGTTGKINVSNEAGTVAMDTANEATSVSGQQSAPKVPAPMTQEEIALAMEDSDLNIYRGD